MLRELRTPALNGSPEVSPRFPEIQNHPQMQWLKTRTIMLFTMLWVRHSGATRQVQLVPASGAGVAVTRVARGSSPPPLWARPLGRRVQPLPAGRTGSPRLRAGGAADTRALEAWTRRPPTPTVTTCRSSEHPWAGPAPGGGEADFRCAGRLRTGRQEGIASLTAVSHGVTWKMRHLYPTDESGHLCPHVRVQHK